MSADMHKAVTYACGAYHDAWHSLATGVREAHNGYWSSGAEHALERVLSGGAVFGPIDPKYVVPSIINSGILQVVNRAIDPDWTEPADWDELMAWAKGRMAGTAVDPRALDEIRKHIELRALFHVDG